MPLQPIQCPVSGCTKTVQGWEYLGRHTKPVHGICADCAILGKTECRCDEERAAEQAERGRFTRVTLLNRRSFIVEDLRGVGEGRDFLSGEGVDADCRANHNLYFIARAAIRHLQPLAYNLITGLLEPELDAATGRPVPKVTP